MKDDSFGKVAKRIERSFNKAKVRTINKAVTKGRGVMASELAKETGIRRSKVNDRLKAFRATIKTGTAVLSVGVKFGMSLAEFKPRVKKVKVTPKNSNNRTSRRYDPKRGTFVVATERGQPKQRTYTGVTVKIGSGPRELVPGAWLWMTKGGKNLVLIRKKSYQGDRYAKSNTEARPTAALKSQILRDAAVAKADKIGRFVVSEYRRLMQVQLDKALREERNK